MLDGTQDLTLSYLYRNLARTPLQVHWESGGKKLGADPRIQRPTRKIKNRGEGELLLHQTPLENGVLALHRLSQ